MFLYNLTLQAPTTISGSILGHFAGKKSQEIVVARHQRLEIWRADTATGKLDILHSEDLFCRVRSISPFRVTGGSKDYIVLSSDAGALVIIEYIPDSRRFVTVQAHDFGRTGLRRLGPGQYVAADPRGRAVMVGGIEKSKLVYIISRDSEANLLIGSPLEANKAQTFCFDIVGVDVGYENPVFAAIETSYANIDTDPTGALAAGAEKLLVHYELDLGLNHVVRKWSTRIPDTANKLIAVPGGNDGPSGVLVCSEGSIAYINNTETPQCHRVPIPRRNNPVESTGHGIMIVASAVHRMKASFFILVQGETGDLYKIHIDYKEDQVSKLSIKYFDTISPAASINILRAGFLFCGSECGSHQFFQFENLGDDIDTPEYTSVEGKDSDSACFQPHELASLGLVDEIETLNPIIKSKVLNLAQEESPQIYALCGKGPKSSLKIIRHGLEVSELAVSELPGTPQSVWTIKRHESSDFDEYIVVSFLDATLVLSVGEEVEEVTDSGLLGTSPTLCLQRLDGDTILQITPRAVRCIMADGRVNEWLPPQNREITAAAATKRQAAVSLARTGGQVIYFELNSRTGTLREYEERLTVGSDVTCMGISAVPPGLVNAPFMAVGCEDQTVRIFSLDPRSRLESLGMQAVTDEPTSVAIASQLESMRLYIGLKNGLLVRAKIDETSGVLDDSRTRFLGSRAVRLSVLRNIGDSGDSVAALSSSPWLCYAHGGRQHMAPMSYDALDSASGFVSEQCPKNGLVAVSGNTLRIIGVDKLDSSVTQASIPLAYTPRDFVLNEESRHFAVIETEHAHYSATEFKRRLVAANEVADSDEAESAVLPAEQFGHVRADAGQWASLIRVVNPFNGDSTQVIELDNNLIAVSMAQVAFADDNPSNSSYLAVGCVQDMALRQRSFSSSAIRIYRWSDDGTQLELVHTTQVEAIPQAMTAFNGGQLLVGLGPMLRLYALGKKRLLRKAQSTVAPTFVTSIHLHPTSPMRVFVADAHESVQLVAFNQNTHNFHVILDDTLPRHMTAFRVLEDGETLIGGDKFGNLFGLRAPADVSEALDADPTGNTLIYKKPKLGGAAHRWRSILEYHTGDIITSISVCELVPGARQVVVYTTVLGSIQVAIPFVSKGDVEFFQTLEMHVRALGQSVSTRNHLSYRSAFVPVRAVVDGDLCETYCMFEGPKMAEIAEEMDRSPEEIVKKLEDMRSLFAF